MNRAAFITAITRERKVAYFALAMQDAEVHIKRLGVDRWMQKEWGLTGSAAESAWWGVLSVLGELDLRKERR